MGPSLGAELFPALAGVEAGAWFHVAAYPWVHRDSASRQRKGLALAIDVTPAAVLTASPRTPIEPVFGIHAALGVGYEVF
jgi:hypothetical protein